MWCYRRQIRSGAHRQVHPLVPRHPARARSAQARLHLRLAHKPGAAPHQAPGRSLVRARRHRQRECLPARRDRHRQSARWPHCAAHKLLVVHHRRLDDSRLQRYGSRRIRGWRRTHMEGEQSGAQHDKASFGSAGQQRRHLPEQRLRARAAGGVERAHIRGRRLHE
jgi:hypothetical protein